MLATFSASDLLNEVQAMVDSQEHAVETDWFAQQVMMRHQNIFGDDADFYRLCAWAHVKDTVRTVLRRYRLEDHSEERDRQLLLPGHERLQRKYHIDRGGKSFLVPIEEITQDEMRAKIREQERLIEGWRIHVAEMRRYYFERWNEHA